MEGITVETEPSAEVFLDGLSQGLADSHGVLVIRAKVGAHALKVSQPGKRSFEQNLALIDGQPLHVVAPLVGLTGGLRIKALPGATVWLDNVNRGIVDGRGEFHIGDLPAGPHSLRISSPGKVDDSHDVMVASGGEVSFVVNLLDTLQANPQDGLKYVWVAAGTFLMGCSPGDVDCSASEKPSHLVTIRKAFWIGQTEVPVGVYRRFARATKTRLPPSGPKSYRNWNSRDLPMVNETWDEASQYCTWAGGRLPTEAEWEFAARGGSPRARYGTLGDIAWFKENADSQTHPIGQKLANGYGLLDVIGNVWEWVNDWYDPNYYQSSPSQDPPDPRWAIIKFCAVALGSSIPNCCGYRIGIAYNPMRGRISLAFAAYGIRNVINLHPHMGCQPQLETNTQSFAGFHTFMDKLTVFLRTGGWR